MLFQLEIASAIYHHSTVSNQFIRPELFFFLVVIGRDEMLPGHCAMLSMWKCEAPTPPKAMSSSSWLVKVCPPFRRYGWQIRFEKEDNSMEAEE